VVPGVMKYFPPAQCLCSQRITFGMISYHGAAEVAMGLTAHPAHWNHRVVRFAFVVVGVFCQLSAVSTCLCCLLVRISISNSSDSESSVHRYHTYIPRLID